MQLRAYEEIIVATYFLRRLSCTTHSTLSHLQLPQGAPSTTSHLTFLARQLTYRHVKG